MLERIGQGWRVLATAFCFAVFGIGGLMLRIAVFPVLSLLVRDRGRRISLARGLIRYSFLVFVSLMRFLGIFRFTVSGIERLRRQGMLVVSNHPTLIDTVFLIALIERADCVVKNVLWSNPFTRGPLRAAGYISNADSAGLVDDCIASLRQGSNLIIFPEGTRTPDDGVVVLKRGAANIAVRGRRNLTPVIIRCYPRMLGKGKEWWRVPARWVHFHIEVREDIDVLPFVADSGSDVLAVRRLTHYLQDYFNKENKPHAFA